ncbi:MAG: serine hydrolase domain-containing protein [Candidatus Aminicenantales bacterium]
MKKRINILFSFLLLLILIIMSGVISCVKKNDKKLSDFKAEVDAYIKPYLDLGGYSGTVLIAKNGEILFRKGYGMASYEFDVPNTAKTKFQIASLSKSFTSAAIMILQERGKLSVHDPLSKFIPDYPGGKKITIHHLLTHTSGIPNVNNFPEYSRDSRFPQTLDEIIKMFKDKPLMFEPGEKYSYSNSNYNLLAYIIEKVSGVSYGEFLRKNIFQTLEMNETGHHGEASAIIKNLASGYMPAGL